MLLVGVEPVSVPEASTAAQTDGVSTTTQAAFSHAKHRLSASSNPTGYLMAATATASTLAVTDPATVGPWSPVQSWPLVAVHMSMLPTGKVLTWDDHTSSVGADVSQHPDCGPIRRRRYFLLRPHPAPSRVLVAGGHANTHVGIRDANIFDPYSQTWSSGALMQYGRWYPTVASLPDARVLVTPRRGPWTST